MNSRLDALLQQRIVVCCGSGGVGKTTIAASIAVRAARSGKRALALTVDPARRLADSLGVALGNEPTPIPAELQKRLGIPPGGHLSAMMLDTKSTFDSLVHRLSPSPQAEARILANRYYQQISRSMVGSQEYMAMEKLLEVHETGAFDIIVLDTPPSRHALDFLSAPGKLNAVLEEGALSWLLAASQSSVMSLSAAVARKMATILGKMEDILGLSVLSDLADFVADFKDLLRDFKARAMRSQALLKAPSTSFLLVASPDRTSLEEAAYFHDQLQQRRFPFAGFVINRVLPLTDLRADDPGLSHLLALGDREWLAQFPPGTIPPLDPAERDPFLLKLRMRFRNLVSLAEIDRANMAELIDRRPGPLGVHRVPELPEDIHDLEALGLLGDVLFGAESAK